MQKKIIFILIATLFISCGKSEYSKELRACIVPTEAHLVDTNREVSISQQPQYFSYGFWNYFSQQHKHEFSEIFYSKYVTKRSMSPTKDELLLQVELDSNSLHSILNTLPNRASKTKLFIARDYRIFMSLLKDSTYKPVFLFSAKFAEEFK